MQRGEPIDDANGHEYYQCNSYDGSRAPLYIADIDCENEPAVILGELRNEGLIIRAEGIGLLVVEKAPPNHP